MSVPHVKVGVRMLSSISVFFPCYNEEQNIPELVESACAFLPTIAKKFEIIIINDGSKDNTTSAVKRLQKECKQLRVVDHDTNLGYGAALRSGIRASTMEWIFWSDADLQFDIKTLKGFLPYTDSNDAIIGYRAHRADTFLRKVNGELYTRLINILFGLGVRDIDCAFKLIRADKLHAISPTTSSAFTSAEILIKLKKSGVKFKQLPVPHFPRKKGNPTGGNIRVILRGLWQTLSFYFNQSG